MALAQSVIDVPLSPLNQVPPDNSGPLGRLTSMINAQIRRYEPHYQGATGVVPEKVQVEPRDGFNSLTTVTRSVTDGTVTSGIWTNPELLNSIGDQLVSIADSTPRVYNGTDWSLYPNSQILTGKLSQDIFYTSQRTIQASDLAVLNGVQCAVWTETQVTATGPLTSTWVGFRGPNRTWLVSPTRLYASNDPLFATQAKVVQDGTYFWVFASATFFGGSQGILVTAYDTHGATLGGTSIAGSPHEFESGMWDVTAVPSTGGYTVLAAVLTDGSTNAGVTVTALKLTGSTVTQNSVALNTVQADWRISFLTNLTGNGRCYLASALTGSPMSIYAYEILNQAITQSYASTTANYGAIDALAGYVTDAVSRTLVISYTQLATDEALIGPPHDPQRRLTKSYSVTTPGVVTQLRSTQSVALVSRAFQVDDSFYCVGYYQSGSGLSVNPTKQTVTMEAGDSMIGAAIQPITIQAGDGTEGSPISLTGASGGGSGNPNIRQTTGGSASGILAGDWVRVFRSVNTPGVPDGTALWEWYFQNQSAGGGSVGSRIKITGSTISGANTTWDVIDYDTIRQTFYTLPSDINGQIPFQTDATFGAGGTIQEIGMVGYQVQDLSPILTGQVANNTYVGGSVTITGSNFSNGTFTVARVYLGTGPTYNTIGTGSVIWVPLTTQTGENHTFAGTLSGDLPNSWTFRSETFDSTYVGADLVISANPALPANVGNFPITSVVNNNLIDTSGTWLPQIFTLPYPTAAIQLTTQVAYTFKLQALTLDYTYQGALVSVQGATSVNNGTYKIVQLNADNTFIAVPQNGLTNQVNEQFPNTATITIFFSQAIQPPFQSTWFLVPLTGSQPVAGRWEYGSAYADWRVEDDATIGTSIYPCAATTPCLTPDGWQLLLPYRAENVTETITESTTAGQVSIFDQQLQSTVGLKLFTLSKQSGQSYVNGSELLIPGPMATTFTSSGFFEDNINLAPEAPFLVSQSTASSGQLGLTPSATYEYSVVAEYTDLNGNRIYSPPSPPLLVSMSGTNNVATLGGRLIFPLDTTGAPIANTYGPTARQVTISIYRTAWINGEPTTIQYKITTDLNVNGLAPIDATNPSGFSFPDSYTWNYKDQNADTLISGSEILYTSEGFLPRYPAPAFSTGVGSWLGREWVIGYDGAVYFSGPKFEGQAIWFHPQLFRFPFPAEDPPKALAAMEGYLLVFCAKSIWYIPAFTLPDATGSGSLPDPVRLPFQNGCKNGFAITIREGAVYDSTAGGCWIITRSLTNEWLSHPVMNSLTNDITGLALDEDQRLFVTQANSNVVCVYDGIPGAWYEWHTPTQPALLSTHKGQGAYQDTTTVNILTTGSTADVIAGTTYGIAPDITLASVDFAGVRNLKAVWGMEIVGEYLGPHNINIELSYPGDDVPTTYYGPFKAVAGVPYVYEFNPAQEEASTFGVRIYADFNGISVPGSSFSLEMISAEVGLDPIGLNKRPKSSTITKR